MRSRWTLWGLARLLVFVSAATAGGMCGGAEPADAWPEITPECKPWTRWWWLGSAVDEAGLKQELAAFAEAGFGGVEITPIYGARGAG